MPTRCGMRPSLLHSNRASSHDAWAFLTSPSKGHVILDKDILRNALALETFSLFYTTYCFLNPKSTQTKPNMFC